MAASYSFSVSLRVTHPKMDPEKLSTALRLKPSNSWKAGEPRLTPRGTRLPGMNRETFWTARLVEKRFATRASRSLEATLSREVENLQKHGALLRRIRKTGGKAELFIGIFGEAKSNFGSQLDATLLASLAKLGLSLDLDIYP